MKTSDLTDAEQALIDSFPGPPTSAVIKSTNIWIIEWLPEDDQRTGGLLHEWMQERRRGWSAYYSCACKKDVLSFIDRSTNLAKKTEMIPVLHLEAHGNEKGLGLPDCGNGDVEFLTWDELTEPLQRLNLATRCNLVLVVAACVGFAGIKALVRGPRAPAIALVGPSATIVGSNLLNGTKEFYRRWMDEKPKLAEITASASREAGTVIFEWEPFAVFAYDALAKQLIFFMRRNQPIQVNLLQRMWDKMFMIDLYPGNKERFGVNWSHEIELVLDSKHFKNIN